MIPGQTPRRSGCRWFEALIGSLLQSVLVTVLVGAVMVLSAMMSLLIPTYGLFMVGMLNCAMFLMAFKIRAMFDTSPGLSSPTGNGIVSSYVAMKMMGAASRGGKAFVKGGAKATVGSAQRHRRRAPERRSRRIRGPGETGPVQPVRGGPPRAVLEDLFHAGLREGRPDDGSQSADGRPRAITSKGQHQAQHTPRPAGFPHSEPKVDPGAPTVVGKPGDIPAPVDAAHPR